MCGANSKPRSSSSSNGDRSTPSFSLMLFLIVVITSCGQMAQTVFVPALPDIASSLVVAPARLEAVMACYLLAYGLMQFVYGPASDRWGRKPLLMIGLSIFVVGAVMAARSASFTQLIIATLIQGAGTATVGALCRSIPRDRYSGKPLLVFNSYCSMAMVLSPLIAPFAGGFMTEYFGWQSLYWLISGLGVAVMLLIMFKFQESLPPEQRKSESVLASYRFVFSRRSFRGYLLALIATFSGIAAFEAVSGVLYGPVLKLSPFLVSCYFVVPIPGYLLGSYYAGKMNDGNKSTYHSVALLGVGALFMLVPGIFNLVIGWTLLIGSGLFFTGAGIICPVLTSAALEPFPRQAGVAGALLGGLQNVGAGVSALLMSFAPMHGQFSLGVVCGMMVVVVIFALNYARPDGDLNKGDVVVER